MPAEVESAFTAGEAGAAWWDTIGTHHHDEYPKGIAQAREWAGQAWEPEERPVFARQEVADPETFEFQEGDEAAEIGPPGEGRLVVYRKLAGEKRIVRSDTGLHICTVPNSYEPIGNGEMWSIVEAICAEPNVMFETGGVLTGSRAVWALARLDEPWQAPGDPSETYPFVAFQNSFNRDSAATARNLQTRIVCRNTWEAAEAEGQRTGRQFTFRHTKGAHDKIEAAKLALQGLRASTQQWQELATALALLPVTDRQRELFVVEFIPKPVGEVISDRVVANVDEARAAVRAILASDTCKGIDHTAYGLVQAAGEYLDHVRGYRSRDTLLGRQLLKPEPLKGRAVALARKVAATDLTAKQLEEVSA
jgi:phage/plasmid-like protein (TIGR03299 family)